MKINSLPELKYFCNVCQKIHTKISGVEEPKHTYLNSVWGFISAILRKWIFIGQEDKLIFKQYYFTVFKLNTNICSYYFVLLLE